MRTDPSGRVPYSSLPAIIQRFGITLTENDVISAAKDLDYNGKKFFSIFKREYKNEYEQKHKTTPRQDRGRDSKPSA